MFLHSSWYHGNIKAASASAFITGLVVGLGGPDGVAAR